MNKTQDTKPRKDFILKDEKGVFMKYRLIDKLKYMVLGSLLTIIVFTAGTLTNQIEADSTIKPDAEFNTLTVQTLIVKDKLVVTDKNETETRLAIDKHDRRSFVVDTNANSNCKCITEIDGRCSYIADTKTNSNCKCSIVYVTQCSHVTDISTNCYCSDSE